jgi:hypothetical protein
MLRAEGECACVAQIARAKIRGREWRPGHHGKVSSTNNERRRGKWTGRHDQVPAAHNERRRGQRPGHHDQVPTLRRGHRPGRHDQVPATHNEWRREQRPEHHDQVPARRRGTGLETTIKYLRGAAGILFGTTAKYLRRSTSGAASNGLCTTTKYLRGAAGIGLGTTTKYLENQNAGSGRNWAKAHYTNTGHVVILIPLYYSGLCSKLRAPHRATSLGSCVPEARARLLCVLCSSNEPTTL